MKKTGLSIIAATLLAGSTWAHHAMEYIELESYQTNRRGESLIYLQYDYMVPDGDEPGLDRWEITPGWAYGLTDKLMFDIHTHFARFRNEHIVEAEQERFEPHGPSPFFEAVSASLLYRFTAAGPYHVAVSTDVEVPLPDARDLLGDDDLIYSGTLILGWEFASHANVVLNVGMETDGSDHEGFWGIGAKTPLAADPHGVAGGIEILGDFDGDEWKVIPGVYLPLGNEIQWKTGFSFGQEKSDGRWVSTRSFTAAIMVPF